MSEILSTLGMAGIVGVIAAYCLGTFGPPLHHYLAPLPVPLFLLTLAGVSRSVVAVTASLAFLAWSPSLLSGATNVPKRTVVMYIVLCGLSSIFYLISIPDALRQQGLMHFVVMTTLNVLLAIASGLLLWINAKYPGFLSALVAHGVIFCWACSYAFANFGELF